MESTDCQASSSIHSVTEDVAAVLHRQNFKFTLIVKMPALVFIINSINPNTEPALVEYGGA